MCRIWCVFVSCECERLTLPSRKVAVGFLAASSSHTTAATAHETTHKEVSDTCGGVEDTHDEEEE